MVCWNQISLVLGQSRVLSFAVRPHIADAAPGGKTAKDEISFKSIGNPRGLLSYCKTSKRCPCHPGGREFESRRFRQFNIDRQCIRSR